MLSRFLPSCTFALYSPMISSIMELREATEWLVVDTKGSSSLRRELSFRAQRYAASQVLLHESTDGETPCIIFGRDDTGRHGNFHPASYERICDEPLWA